ncbi:hypothetical protein [Corynebacterium lehmanniae]|uniref:Uncharacterized protein n=1 Tax=Corynebacterium lehmanniae TaxID=2913497 RepID=A0ABT4R907_9CORY|nr:hypothetical protein [Corynebacterium lehmanniae]MCZ9292045.1 hypothetical protein [Corynebacterium lehmanniae]
MEHRRPNRSLHEMADNLQPHHVPVATGKGIDPYLAVWSLDHPEVNPRSVRPYASAAPPNLK